MRDHPPIPVLGSATCFDSFRYMSYACTTRLYRVSSWRLDVSIFDYNNTCLTNRRSRNSTVHFFTSNLFSCHDIRQPELAACSRHNKCSAPSILSEGPTHSVCNDFRALANLHLFVQQVVVCRYLELSSVVKNYLVYRCRSMCTVILTIIR